MKIKLTMVVLFLVSLFGIDFAKAQSEKQATWIWYPGDYDIWLGNQMQNRRTERGAFFPPFWRLYSHYVLVDYMKTANLPEAEEIEIFAEGPYNIKIDSKMLPGMPQKVTVPAGSHTINIKVYSQEVVPALYIKGALLASDSSWTVTYEDKEWIDASGKVSDQSGTVRLNASSWNFIDPLSPPSGFKLSVEPMAAVSVTKKAGGALVDFGKETFGYIKLHGVSGNGKINLYYGESMEEALSPENCETLDRIEITSGKNGDLTIDHSQAFRYVNIQPEGNVNYDSVSMFYEYLPLEYRGKFRCNDEQINKIWDVAAYTMHLTSREFFIDGIKRDRWVWSGDANQSYLMNYYLFFDSPSVKRTINLLRGKDPVSSHINTIMDYSFYWFISIYDYYLHSGDKAFIQEVYPKMKSMMEFCLDRRNEHGLMEGLAGDWVFIDWADGLSKQGEVSFEQLLFTRSLEAMALCAEINGDLEDKMRYEDMASRLKEKLFSIYWSNEKNAIVHSRVDGRPTNDITRYANMFAIFFDYLDEDKKQAVKEHVLLNDEVQKITTPYMRFYELEALSAMGEQDYVLREIKDYWGGMLDLGATSFWEKYDPDESGIEHYAMYGRPFGKSLCHAWGASPIYLLGKYFLGVKPTAPGYQEYVVEPELGGMEWMEGVVPTPEGDIRVFVNNRRISVSSDTGQGTLRFESRVKPALKGAAIRQVGDRIYEMTIEKGKEYEISYRAVK